MDFADKDELPRLNRRVRRLLFEWGGDVQKPHSIDHFFYAAKMECAEALCRWASARGFDPSEIHETTHDGVLTHSFTITVTSLPNDEELDQQTHQMLQTATEHECTYDGWGTLIEE